MKATRGWRGRASGELLSNGYRVSIWEDEIASDHSGDGFTIT